MKYLLIAMSMFFASLVSAAVCTSPATVPVACQGAPTGSVCLTWSMPTTRETVNGVTPAMAPSEIKNYEIYLDNVLLSSPAASTLVYVHQIPTNQTLTTSSVWKILTVDTSNVKSNTPFTCSQAVAVSGPKSGPAAPTATTTVQ